MRNPQRQTAVVDVVMPALNEERCIRESVEVLFEAAKRIPYRIELVVVDDGSTDQTAAIVRQLQRVYPVRLVSLTRNFGKEAALLAGLDHTSGAATILMDADLQHPVETLSEFLSHWEAGWDCVYAVREGRTDETRAKRVFTWLFYRLINRGAAHQIPRNALDFRLLDRKVVEALCSLREHVRFTKGLYAWLGFRSIAVPVAVAPRHSNVSRFNLGKLMQLGWDGLTSFSDWPLRASGAIGLLVASASIAYGAFITLRTLLLGVDVPGWATITVVLSFLGGLQLMFLGILGQYVSNIFVESKQRPNYLVADLSESALCHVLRNTAARNAGNGVPIALAHGTERNVTASLGAV